MRRLRDLVCGIALVARGLAVGVPTQEEPPTSEPVEDVYARPGGVELKV